MLQDSFAELKVKEIKNGRSVQDVTKLHDVLCRLCMASSLPLSAWKSWQPHMMGSLAHSLHSSALTIARPACSAALVLLSLGPTGA